MIIFSII